MRFLHKNESYLAFFEVQVWQLINSYWQLMSLFLTKWMKSNFVERQIRSMFNKAMFRVSLWPHLAVLRAKFDSWFRVQFLKVMFDSWLTADNSFDNLDEKVHPWLLYIPNFVGLCWLELFRVEKVYQKNNKRNNKNKKNMILRLT